MTLKIGDRVVAAGARMNWVHVDRVRKVEVGRVVDLIICPCCNCACSSHGMGGDGLERYYYQCGCVVVHTSTTYALADGSFIRYGVNIIQQCWETVVLFA